MRKLRIHKGEHICDILIDMSNFDKHISSWQQY